MCRVPVVVALVDLAARVWCVMDNRNPLPVATTANAISEDAIAATPHRYCGTQGAGSLEGRRVLN